MSLITENPALIARRKLPSGDGIIMHAAYAAEGR